MDGEEGDAVLNAIRSPDVVEVIRGFIAVLKIRDCENRRVVVAHMVSHIPTTFGKLERAAGLALKAGVQFLECSSEDRALTAALFELAKLAEKRNKFRLACNILRRIYKKERDDLSRKSDFAASYLSLIAAARRSGKLQAAGEIANFAYIDFPAGSTEKSSAAAAIIDVAAAAKIEGKLTLAARFAEVAFEEFPDGSPQQTDASALLWSLCGQIRASGNLKLAMRIAAKTYYRFPMGSSEQVAAKDAYDDMLSSCKLGTATHLLSVAVRLVTKAGDVKKSMDQTE